MSSKKKGRIGSSFEGFLKGEGACEKTSTLAIKRTLAWQRENAMAKKSLTRNEMAKRKQGWTWCNQRPGRSHPLRKQRLHEPEPRKIPDPHRVEHADQVVALVLHDTGVEAFDLAIDGGAELVEATITDP